MAMRFGVKRPIDFTPAPIPVPRVIPPTAAGDREVIQHVRMNESNLVTTTAIVDAASLPDHDESSSDGTRITGNAKLTRLLDDDFPFDDSQRAAISALAEEQYGCLTGAAGTGKTTVTKAIVDRIKDGLSSVDMTDYFTRTTPGTEAHDDLMDRRSAVSLESVLDDGDEYEIPKGRIPSICLVGFTGRSTQMIKKNFPRDWHPNIMTIHRCLAFAPEWYEDFDDESGGLVQKMRFTPTYNKLIRLPWDVIIIDEAGMVSTDLWQQLYDAMKDGTRVIMIGDINQLPPVHGRSIFGFALSQWPAFELTTIHRQVGVNNSIVDSAWNILKGYRPKSDILDLSLGDSTNPAKAKDEIMKTLQALKVRDDSWKFVMVKVPEEENLAAVRIRKVLQMLNGRSYDPMHDSVITAINGHDGSRGQNLGQIPMNRELAFVINPDAPRFVIDAGRERKQFAVGDKVMATKNDHEIGVTNGMTGIIIDIKPNGAYLGNHRQFGLIEDVNAYYAEEENSGADESFSIDDLNQAMDDMTKGKEMAKEGRDRGPSSHTVTVRFGEGPTAIETAFGSLAEMYSLMTAYVVTCHKMQGGESPFVMTIAHQSHKSMLYREWLYTAVTRASQHCVVFYTDLALRVALTKQKIVGKNLAEKVKVFQRLCEESVLGKAVNINLPTPRKAKGDA